MMVVPRNLATVSSEVKSTNSSGLKSRPAISVVPSVRRSSPLSRYVVALSADTGRSGCSDTPLFQEERPNGTWLVAATEVTPGTVRSAARSSRVSAIALSSLPMPAKVIMATSSSATPLGMLIRAMRSLIRNTALQMIAQLSAISSTISAAAVLCRRRVERMGRISMTGLIGS
jgi:hypothetical protein